VVIIRDTTVMASPAVSLGQFIERMVIKTDVLIDRWCRDICHGHTGDQGNACY
jgi:hypothetical protein